MKIRASKKLLLIAVCASAALCVSCDRGRNKLAGAWKNESKIIEFTENTFVIKNLTAENILGFKGTYTFSANNKNAVELRYEYYADADFNWIPVEGTELENYIDYLAYRANKNILRTKVAANGAAYVYSRIR